MGFKFNPFTGNFDIDSVNATSNSFETIQPDSGTSPVADSPTDVLTITGTGGITVIGNSSTDTITIDGSGNSPGGAVGSVQFNNSGVFGGFGNWNGTDFTPSGNIQMGQSFIQFTGPTAGISYINSNFRSDAGADVLILNGNGQPIFTVGGIRVSNIAGTFPTTYDSSFSVQVYGKSQLDDGAWYTDGSGSTTQTGTAGANLFIVPGGGGMASDGGVGIILNPFGGNVTTLSNTWTLYGGGSASFASGAISVGDTSGTAAWINSDGTASFVAGLLAIDSYNGDGRAIFRAGNQFTYLAGQPSSGGTNYLTLPNYADGSLLMVDGSGNLISTVSMGTTLYNDGSANFYNGSIGIGTTGTLIELLDDGSGNGSININGTSSTLSVQGTGYFAGGNITIGNATGTTAWIDANGSASFATGGVVIDSGGTSHFYTGNLYVGPTDGTGLNNDGTAYFGGGLFSIGYAGGGGATNYIASDSSAKFASLIDNSSSSGASGEVLTAGAGGQLIWGTASSSIAIGDPVSGGSATGAILYVDTSGNLANDVNTSLDGNGNASFYNGKVYLGDNGFGIAEMLVGENSGYHIWFDPSVNGFEVSDSSGNATINMAPNTGDAYFLGAGYFSNFGDISIGASTGSVAYIDASGEASFATGAITIGGTSGTAGYLAADGYVYLNNGNMWMGTGSSQGKLEITNALHAMAGGFSVGDQSGANGWLHSDGMSISTGQFTVGTSGDTTTNTLAMNGILFMQSNEINGVGFISATDTNSAINLNGTRQLIASDGSTVQLNWQTAGSLTSTADATFNNINSGTYTPTLTNVANLDGSTAFQCQYMRVGSVVTVSGKVSVDPTTAVTSTQLGISLPIASNLGANEDCAGVAFASGIAAQGAAILGDATNNRAQMQWIAGDVTNQAMYFSFTYEII